MITRRLANPLVSASKWTCPSCTRSSFLRQRNQPQQRRTILHVPPLAHEAHYQADGIQGLFSKRGFELAWTEYQGLLVRKLNDLLAGEPYADMQPKDLAIKFARDPLNASLFNHASMAHNNQFFFAGLSVSPLKLDKAPAIKEGLEDTFGSIETLRATMLDTADSMFGPGFVWLVWMRGPSETGTGIGKGSYRILTTYLAGTPYPEAGYRQQGIDMATNNASSYEAYRQQQQQQQQPANSVGAFGHHSAAGKESAKYPPGGASVTPLLCVNTWEHAYMHDFGLGGKRRYLADWWNAVDWHHVEMNAPREARPVNFK